MVDIDLKEMDIVQFSATISGDGGRERFMRTLDRAIDAEPLVLTDKR